MLNIIFHYESRYINHVLYLQQQQHSLFSQASWGRLEMKPERNNVRRIELV